MPLDPKKLRKISEDVQRRKKASGKRSMEKARRIIEEHAKRKAQELIPEAEKKVEKAARKGESEAEVYYYRDSFGSLNNTIADLIAAHFSKDFPVVRRPIYDEGYQRTLVIVSIRE